MRGNLSHRTGIAARALMAILLLGTVVACMQAQEVALVGTKSGDEDAHSDELLARYLNEQIPELKMTATAREYEETVKAIRENNQTPLLVRATPYVLVSAQLLGAKVQILGVYQRYIRKPPNAPPEPADQSEQDTTYYSYLIVNSNAFDEAQDGHYPSRSEVLDFIKNKYPTFVHGNQYSASGYFVPARNLSDDGIYNGATKGTLTFRSEGSDRDAVDVIKSVAENGQRFTATWDGEIKNLDEATLKKIYRVQLPQELPNDLLVCNDAVPPALVAKLRKALLAMPAHHISSRQKPPGNIDTWLPFADTPRARSAYQRLLQLASEPPRRSVIELKTADGVPAAVTAAVRLAIRRAQSEFVENDALFGKPDYLWELRMTPDQALNITSTLFVEDVPNPKRDLKQSSPDFPFAAASSEDLTRRIREWMSSELAIVRYVWPYSKGATIVLRDFDFAIPNGSTVPYQVITWKDVTRRDFSQSGAGDFEVGSDSTFDTLHLLSKNEQPGSKMTYDPLDRNAVRIFLGGAQPRSRYVAAVPWIVTALFAALTIAFGIDLLRVKRRVIARRAVPSPPGANSVAHYTAWERRKMAPVDVVWCDRAALDTQIVDMQNTGVDFLFDYEGTTTREQGLNADLSFFHYFGVKLGIKKTSSSKIDPKKMSDVRRLNGFLNEVARQKLVAPFVGRPVIDEDLKRLVAEWMVLPNDDGDEDPVHRLDEFDVAREHVQRTLVAFNFYAGLARSEAGLSLFKTPWTIQRVNGDIIFTSPIDWAELHWSSACPRQVNLHFAVAADAVGDRLRGAPPDLWLLGKVDSIDTASDSLTIRYKSIAVLR